MSASAAVRSSFRLAFANTDFSESSASESTDFDPQSKSRSERLRAESIAYILRRTGLTITQLSHITRLRYGIESSYFVPPTFLYKIRSGVTPHICQVAALSESTGYRFVDWIKLFGFDLQHIPRLQMHLHWERTALITPVQFQRSPYPLFSRSSVGQAIHWASTPSPAEDSPLEEGWRSQEPRYCFAKIGSSDAALSRGLAPGMIIRIDRCYRQPVQASHPTRDDGISDHRCQQNLLWLVEHPGGLSCSRIQWVGDHQVTLLPARPPLGSLPLRVPSEARILGLADLELGAARSRVSQFAPGQMKLAQQQQPASDRVRTLFPDLLRAARRRSGLTFRAAHHLTLSIARILGSPDYAIGLGALSDYETVCRLPRHMAKILSLCITYSLDIRRLMESAGVNVDDSDKMPLPLFDQFGASELEFLEGTEQYTTTGLRPPSARSSGERIDKSFPI